MKQMIHDLIKMVNGERKMERIRALTTAEKPFNIGEVITVPVGELYTLVNPHFLHLNVPRTLNGESAKAKVLSVYYGQQVSLWVKMLGEMCEIKITKGLLQANHKPYEVPGTV